MDTDKRKDEQIEQDIIRAIRSRGLREQMQEWEQEAQNQSRKEKPKHRTLWRKIVYPIAAVAILAGVVYAAVPAHTWRYCYRVAQQEYARYFHKRATYQNSSEVLLALAEPSVEEIGNRNNDSHPLGADDPIYEAAVEIKAGHYRIAQSILDDVQTTTSEDNPRYQEIMDDIAYLSALCELGNGHRANAYRQLQVIAQSHNRHSKQAAELLKHFK